MQRRINEGVEVHRSSGNVYADLGLPDADKLKIKTGLGGRDQEGDVYPWTKSAGGSQADGHPATGGVGDGCRGTSPTCPSAN